MGRRDRKPRKPASQDPKAQGGAKSVVRDVLIAVLLVGLVFGGILAYTQVWPPMVVIESKSMQHSDTESFLGVIDTGDLVLVQAARSKADIVTYVEGRNTGHQTYGDYGDVIIFHAIDAIAGRGQYDNKDPVIHRAIVYLEWDAASGGFDIPALSGAGNRGKWGCTSGCNAAAGPNDLRGTIWISIGPWNVSVGLDAYRNGAAAWSRNSQPYSVYVTMGDNNRGDPDDWATPHEAIVGKARGEIPWFGLLKLTLLKTPNCCASWGCVGTGNPCYAAKNSWDALVLSLAVLVATPFLLDLGASAIEKRRARKREKTTLPEPQKA